jgi:DNA-binding response OmpR family regulator
MKKILIIEDENSLGEVLVKKMNTSGYEATWIHDGAEGLATLKTLKPDLLITDIFLPSLNGFEIVARKNAEPAIASIPVILLSNSLYSSKGDDIPAASRGTLEVLVKANITPDHVLEKVRAILEPAAAAAAQAAAQAFSIQGKKILLVEDDAFLGSILVKHLTTSGAEVNHVTTGEAALTQFKEHTPDIALLDILLPGMNGLDVLMHVRQEPTLEHVPVIMISNFNQTDERTKAEKLGATFVVKALVTPDGIVNEIKKILSRV